MRNTLVTISVLLALAMPVAAQVSVGIGIAVPGVSIGISVPAYPQLVRVPGYPVYYAPNLSANFFFYDGLYWVYQADNWYASSWYNGPWGRVGPEMVPLYVLRVPVRYYRQPPPYFRGWRQNAPPRWNEHWGRDWEQGRSGWDQWDRKSAPAPAPLPSYQRRYSGDRYPQQIEQQQSIHQQRYQYRPRDEVVRQHYQQQPRDNGARQQNQQQPRGGGAASEPGRGQGGQGDRGQGDGRGQESHKK